MPVVQRMFAALLLASSLTACGTHAVAPTAAAKVTTASKVAFLDRFEAHVATEAGTEFQVLTLTAKSLMTSFDDDDVTVFTPQRDAAEPQVNLFCSKVFLGQDGWLYLSEKPGNGRARFYQIGTYEQGRQAGDLVKFKLLAGMKLEARNRSIVPAGGGPFIALVVDARPNPTAQSPHFVRGQ